MPKGISRQFLLSVALLLLTGTIVFLSASFGIYARQSPEVWHSITVRQLTIGLLGGLLVMFAFSKIHYLHFRKYAFYIFVLSLIATSLVFIPGLGLKINGATRWLAVGGLTFQPVELLKFGYVVFLAAWIASAKGKLDDWRHGLLPLIIITGLAGLPLALQPDNDSIIFITITGLAMYLVGGGRWRDIGVMFLVGITLFTVMVFARPYVLDRIMTFLNPGDNAQTSGWQIQQSLIAIGSGEIFGKGLGLSVQKMTHLPEHISDSIFSVAGEEFGFLGCLLIIGLFIFFLISALKVAKEAPDQFSGLFTLGVCLLIVVQSFMNIASMIAIIPLSGSPLIFFSHGGSALLFTLMNMGIILNISKYAKKV